MNILCYIFGKRSQLWKCHEMYCYAY